MKNEIFPELSGKLAEFYGALVGDGCLSRFPRKGSDSFHEVTVLTGHLQNDIEYYQTIIRPIIQHAFGTKGYLQRRKKYNCIQLLVSKKMVFQYFANLGFPVGKKIQLQLPAQIMVKNKLAIACVRGIFNTDKSIYRRYSKQYKNHKRFYNYLVIQFKMHSQEVIKQIKEILEQNSIHTTRIHRDSKCFVLRITKQESVHRFIKRFKPSNPYHMKRYLNFASQT